MLQRDGGVRRIADGVGRPAIALEALRQFRVLCGWMNSTAPSSSAFAHTG